ncbi:hypothetical protein WKI65_20395 [Streptomyces sp. MS1.AVA.3]|uniref:hypothetical protein n=1 Tax=Streptomyces decoyicus TaxID=249567 RepID=UPI0030BCCB4C
MSMQWQLYSIGVGLLGMHGTFSHRSALADTDGSKASTMREYVARIPRVMKFSILFSMNRPRTFAAR